MKFMDDLPLGTNANMKDLVLLDDLPEYQKKLVIIHNQLLRLNINIYILEQILKFPAVFFYLGGVIYNTFFESYIENAFDMSVLIITRLSINDKPDAFTMEAFRNSVGKKIKSEYQVAYEELRRTLKWSWKAIKPITDNLEELRNECIAHQKQDSLETALMDSLSSKLQKRQILLSDIKRVCVKLNDSLDKLTFLGGPKFNKLPPWYQEDYTVGKSDIEEILESIAKNSSILSMPETDLDQWFHIMHSRREQIEQFNFYRRKLGLPEMYLD
jgi:hypothetical protein